MEGLSRLSDVYGFTVGNGLQTSRASATRIGVADALGFKCIG